MARPDAVLLSCEHGGNRVPREHRALFRGRQRWLASHRGHDPGALALARLLARRCGWPLLACTTTRLLVEPNRSPGHPALFSPITRRLPPAARAQILARYYAPHRGRVDAAVRRRVSRGSTVLHLAVHSFTPVLRGKMRGLDVGLLYDPARRPERQFAREWQATLGRIAPALRVRCNQPYRGSADGLTTTLRRRLPARSYLGIELEFNQRILGDPRAWRDLGRCLVRSLEEVLGAPGASRRIY